LKTDQGQVRGCGGKERVRGKVQSFVREVGLEGMHKKHVQRRPTLQNIPGIALKRSLRLVFVPLLPNGSSEKKVAVAMPQRGSAEKKRKPKSSLGLPEEKCHRGKCAIRRVFF